MVDLEIKEGDPNGIFTITPTSSRNEYYVEMSPIIANNLQSSKWTTFNLTLKAMDRGTPSKSSEKVKYQFLKPICFHFYFRVLLQNGVLVDLFSSSN